MQIEVENERPYSRTLRQWFDDGKLTAGDILTTNSDGMTSPMITVLILRGLTECVVLEYDEDPGVVNGVEDIDCFESAFMKAVSTKLVIGI